MDDMELLRGQRGGDALTIVVWTGERSSPQMMHPAFQHAGVRDPRLTPLVTEMSLQSPAVVAYGLFSSRF
jgi:hypothetical protein